MTLLIAWVCSQINAWKVLASALTGALPAGILLSTWKLAQTDTCPAHRLGLTHWGAGQAAELPSFLQKGALLKEGCVCMGGCSLTQHICGNRDLGTRSRRLILNPKRKCKTSSVSCRYICGAQCPFTYLPTCPAPQAPISSTTRIYKTTDGCEVPRCRVRLQRMLVASDKLDPHLSHGQAIPLPDTNPREMKTHVQPKPVCERV